MVKLFIIPTVDIRNIISTCIVRHNHRHIERALQHSTCITLSVDSVLYPQYQDLPHHQWRQLGYHQYATGNFTICLQGSMLLSEFLVPSMKGRWSRFALSVSDSSINLFVYCHNYTLTSIKRSSEPFTFSQDSLLLVGHAGGVIKQQFKVRDTYIVWL